jgi:nucleoside 2-deoxyribosyltransferase
MPNKMEIVQPLQITQRCPGCKADLMIDAYTHSRWGVNGERCRGCVASRDAATHKANPEKRAARNHRWHLAHKEQVSNNRRLRKYGITNDDVRKMLERQYYRCLGCLVSISFNACVDHNHETGEVRGMLCDNCNRTLGQTKENKEILRRLMAYLDYDRSKLRIYLAGSLRNPRTPLVAQSLRAVGYDVVDEWYSSGPEADDYWQKYETARGHTYVEALKGRQAENIFLFDKVHLDLSDALVAVLPCGKSAHLEMGYFVGQGKPTFILQSEQVERFEIMPNFVTQVCRTFEDLQLALQHTFQLKKA